MCWYLLAAADCNRLTVSLRLGLESEDWIMSALLGDAACLEIGLRRGPRKLGHHKKLGPSPEEIGTKFSQTVASLRNYNPTWDLSSPLLSIPSVSASVSCSDYRITRGPAAVLPTVKSTVNDQTASFHLILRH